MNTFPFKYSPLSVSQRRCAHWDLCRGACPQLNNHPVVYWTSVTYFLCCVSLPQPSALSLFLWADSCEQEDHTSSKERCLPVINKDRLCSWKKTQTAFSVSFTKHVSQQHKATKEKWREAKWRQIPVFTATFFSSLNSNEKPFFLQQTPPLNQTGKIFQQRIWLWHEDGIQSHCLYI